jgi:hypothetical protein
MAAVCHHFEIECVGDGGNQEGLSNTAQHPEVGPHGAQIDIESETLVSSMPSAMIVSLSHSVLARLAWENSTGRLP